MIFYDLTHEPVGNSLSCAEITEPMTLSDLRWIWGNCWLFHDKNDSLS